MPFNLRDEESWGGGGYRCVIASCEPGINLLIREYLTDQASIR